MKIVKKRIRYPVFLGSDVAYVEYAIWSGMAYKKCVFTGISKPVTTTINAAEDVVMSIARAEDFRTSQRVEFFDLMTHLGYGGHEPGVIQFARLVLKRATDGGTRNFEVDWDWMVRCPENVIEVFRENIGGTRIIQARGNPRYPDPIPLTVPAPLFR